MEEKALFVPYFACTIKQDGNLVRVPVPYGALENFVRMILSHNDGVIEISGFSTMKI